MHASALVMKLGLLYIVIWAIAIKRLFPCLFGESTPQRLY